MKVKIGDKIYHSTETPIAIQVNDRFRKVISEMPEENSVFTAYPKDLNFEDIKEWCKELKITK